MTKQEKLNQIEVQIKKLVQEYNEELRK